MKLTKTQIVKTPARPLFIVFVALLAIAFSCSETDEAVKQSSQVSVEQGTFTFRSQEDFNAMYNSLKNKTDKELDTWEKQFEGFTSMRTVFNSITEADVENIASAKSLGKFGGSSFLLGEGEDKELVINVTDRVLSTLVNTEGLVVIGNTAYKHTYTHTYKVEDFDIATNDIRAYNFTSSNDKVKVVPVERTIVSTLGTTTTLTNGQFSTSRTASNMCIESYWQGGALCCKKRLVGEIEVGGGFVLTIRTKHQRRNSGIWFADETPSLQVNFSYSIQVFDPRGHGYGIQNLTSAARTTNDSKAYYEFSAGINNRIQVYSASATHFGTCDDNKYRECATSFY